MQTVRCPKFQLFPHFSSLCYNQGRRNGFCLGGVRILRKIILLKFLLYTSPILGGIVYEAELKTKMYANRPGYREKMKKYSIGPVYEGEGELEMKKHLCRQAWI